jgi:type VI secretion system protein ImpA
LRQDGTLMLLQQTIITDPDTNEQPSWSGVHEKAFEALSRGRDLRVAVILCLALLKETGPSGLLQGLTLMRKLLEKFPENVYPVPESADDPSRGSALSNLSASIGSDSPYEFVRGLRNSVLVRSPGGNNYSYADLLRADSGQPADENGQVPISRAQIESAFREVGTDKMLEGYKLFEEIRNQLISFEQLLSSHEGSKSGLDLKAVKAILDDILAEVKPWTGVASATNEQTPSTDEQKSGPATPTGALGVVRSRRDADNAIKAVCKYFEETEPSSPIPFFLERVRRLIGKNFVECVRDLSAESLEKFYPSLGISETEEKNKTS